MEKSWQQIGYFKTIITYFFLGLLLYDQQVIAQKSVCYEDGNCYWIWRFETPKTKFEASEHCYSNNKSTLATIPSLSDELTLSNQIDSSSPAWTGLNLSPTANWKWLHKSGWYDSAERAETEDFACRYITPDAIESSACSRQLAYVCEFDAEPLIGCSDRYWQVNTTSGSSWICPKANRLDWPDAARSCSRDKGGLVILNNIEKLSAVQEILETLRSEGAYYFWTAGTSVPLTWDSGENTNPYALRWSDTLNNNPNLDEALRSPDDPFCVILTQREGLSHKKCDYRLQQAICSTVNEVPQSEITSSTVATADPAVTVHTSTQTSSPFVSSITTSSSTASTATPTIHHNSIPTEGQKPNTGSSEDQIPNIGSTEDQISNNKTTTDSLHHCVNGTGTGDGGETKKNYKVIIICAYILAILVIVGLIILLIVFVVRRRRKRKKDPKFYDPATNRSYKTLGNGTLGRQRTTDPEEEWDKVIAENGVETVKMRDKSKDIDIIHNVPLDPRATLEEPLIVPQQTEIVPVTLSRARSKTSSASLVSSEVATFNVGADRRSTSTNSSVLVRVPPPVPPKLKYNRSQSAPASELDPLTSPSSASPQTDTAWEFPPPPPPTELLTENEGPKSPPLPPKPAKRPPARRHRKKNIVPDPIYAKIDKSLTAPREPSTAPPPVTLSPVSNGFTTLPTRLQRQAQLPPDNSDSGIEMGGIHSPPRRNHNNNIRLASSSDNIASLNDGPGSPPELKKSAELQYLDEILAHLNSN